MRLNLIDLLEVLGPVHLDAARSVLLGNSSQDRTSSMKQGDLGDVLGAFVARVLFPSILDFLERFVGCNGVDGVLGVGLEGNAGENDTFLGVLEHGVCLFLVSRLQSRVLVQLPQVHFGVISARDKAAVVIEPLNALNFSNVSLFEVVLGGLLGSVELED